MAETAAEVGGNSGGFLRLVIDLFLNDRSTYI